MGADVVTPAQAKGVREGLADAFTALAQRSWRTGAGYFVQDGRRTEVARDFADPDAGDALMDVIARYDERRFEDPSLDPHATGGVVVTVARSIQEQLGWVAAQDVLWQVLHDTDFQGSPQAWDDLADALRRIAASSDEPTAVAIGDSLRDSGLDAA